MPMREYFDVSRTHVWNFQHKDTVDGLHMAARNQIRDCSQWQYSDWTTLRIILDDGGGDELGGGDGPGRKQRVGPKQSVS